MGLSQQLMGLATAESGAMMNWNKQPIPFAVAERIGWSLHLDVVGAGVYGGIVVRDATGRITVGDEWPENNRAPPAHNPVFTTGPYLDFSKLTDRNCGYSAIAHLVMAGNAAKLEGLLESVDDKDKRRKLANLVMTGGARPLHMCGMSRGGDSSELIKVLLAAGAEVNAKDNYEMTPMDRLSSNAVAGNAVLRSNGGVPGRKLPQGQPQWDSMEFAYQGPGEVPQF